MNGKFITTTLRRGEGSKELEKEKENSKAKTLSTLERTLGSSFSKLDYTKKSFLWINVAILHWINDHRR